MSPLRLFIFFATILGVIFFPWYVPAVIAIVGLVFFDFIEIIFVGFLLDMLYGFSEPMYSRFIFLGISTVLYFLFRNAKKWIRIRVR